MAWTVPNILGTAIDTDITVMANEILISSAETSVIKRLCKNRSFPGAGMIMALPAVDAVTFAAHTEGQEVTSGTADIDNTAYTCVEYVSDYHLGSVSVNYGGAENPLNAIAREFSTAYAKGVDTLLTSAVTATSANVVDTSGTLGMSHMAAAYAKLAAAGAPPPYYAVLHPTDFTSLYSTTGISIATAGGRPDWLEGPSRQWYVGNIAGLEVYVGPYQAASSSIFFSPYGLEWIWKPVIQPETAGSEVGIGLEWFPSFRAFNIHATYIGVAAARIVNGTTGGWVGRLYDAP